MCAQDTRDFSRTKHFLTEFLVANGTPTSLGLYLCIRHGDFKSLVTHAIHPINYEDIDDFQDSYAAVCMVSKLTEVPAFTDDEKKQIALSGYRACEDELVKSDFHLHDIFYGSNPLNHRLQTILMMASRKIDSCLADFGPDEFFDSVRFGPGSSSSMRGRRVTQALKISSPSIECTASAVPLLSAFVRTTRWSENVASIQTKEFSEVITVPKNAKTDRTIGIEPDGNIFLQLGVGAMIRRRLFHVGIDLDHGASVNADLARIGSIDGSLATIDLSAASDRISRKLVKFLLPSRWFALLDTLRTSYAKLGPDLIMLKKFSSMGNGFTFELQSLIFWAIASSVCRLNGLHSEVKVFGDDIIIDSRAYDELCDLFARIGFKVNLRKSFNTSYFRESCGAHFFKGRNIKPVYLKENLHGEFEIYKISNGLRSYCHRTFGVDVVATRYRGLYRALRGMVPRGALVPDGIGDCGFVEYFEAASSIIRTRTHKLGFEGFLVKTRSFEPRSIVMTEPAAFLSVLFDLHRREGFEHRSILSVTDPLRASNPNGEGLLCPLRGRGRLRTRVVLVPQWTNPGEI